MVIKGSTLPFTRNKHINNKNTKNIEKNKTKTEDIMISQKYRELNFVCFIFSVGNPTSAKDSILLLTNAQPKGTNLNFPLCHSKKGKDEKTTTPYPCKFVSIYPSLNS